MLKKILSFVLALLMVFPLLGCESSEGMGIYENPVFVESNNVGRRNIGGGSFAAELAWRNINNSEDIWQKIEDASEQFVLGNYTDKVTILGTTLQIAAGLANVDFIMDLRDISADFTTNWDWSWQHAGTIIVDIIAIVPVIGSAKYFDEAIYIIKYGDEGCAVLQYGDELAGLGDEVGNMGDELDELVDMAKPADELVDAAKDAKNLVKRAFKEIPDKKFKSFDELKDYLGSAGPNRNWHHIVEQAQCKASRANFSKEDINSLRNIINMPSGKGSIHEEISAAYSRKYIFTEGKTFRDWLASKTFEEQMIEGIKMLQQFGNVDIIDGRWVFTPFDS